MRYSPILIVVLCGAVVAAERGPGARQIPVDVIKLKDGRTLVGHYNEDAGKLAVVSKSTGRTLGVLAVKPDQIESRTKDVISLRAKKAAAKKPYGLDGKWVADYKRAIASAKANGKLILADFTGSDWCPWCVKLRREVFEDAKFRAWAKGRVVLLELDFPRRKRQSASLRAQNQGLAKKYGIRGFPTVLVIDKNEKVLRQWGYFPGGFAKWVDGLTKDQPALASLKRN